MLVGVIAHGNGQNQPSDRLILKVLTPLGKILRKWRRVNKVKPCSISLLFLSDDSQVRAKSQQQLQSHGFASSNFESNCETCDDGKRIAPFPRAS